MSVKKIIQLTENDLEKIVKRIIKEEAGTDLLTNALNAYKDNFEVYCFNKGPREYFLDNHIVFEVGGVDELFLNFVMYEDGVDTQDALKVVNWLYPRLDKLFGGKIAFMDNLDDE